MCRSRIALLRALNPSVPIYGLFGGSKLERSVAKMLLDLEGLYVSTRPERWNWQHSDLAVAAWYREVGSRVPFDVAHVIEWDLLLLAPLQSLYAHVPQDTVGLTALTPVSVLEHEWTWLRREESRREWDTLPAVRAPTGVITTSRTGARPGPVLSEGIPGGVRRTRVSPVLCNDELRLPLFAQILGFPLADTRLRGPWHGEREDPFFHFRDKEIDVSAIRAELAKHDGWRAFHPVRTRLDPQQILGSGDRDRRA